MRSLLLAVLFVAVAFIAIHRERLFLRDPLGKVLVNGVAVPGSSVLINYSNDVLVWVPGGGAPVLVQGWDRTLGHPRGMSCWRKLVCMMETDHAAKGLPTANSAVTGMSDREVTYRAGVDAMRVVIR